MTGSVKPIADQLNTEDCKVATQQCIFNWYHLPNPDLFIDDDMDEQLSPLEWLAMGYDPELVKILAGNL